LEGCWLSEEVYQIILGISSNLLGIMRIDIVLLLSVLTVLSSLCGAQQVTTEELIDDELEHDDGNCTEQNLNCTEDDDVEGDRVVEIILSSSC